MSLTKLCFFSVFTPYYSETVLYSYSSLWVENVDGISTLFYLQTIFPGNNLSRKLLFLKEIKNFIKIMRTNA